MNDKPTRRGNNVKRFAFPITVITCGLIVWYLSQRNNVPPSSKTPLVAASLTLSSAISNGVSQSPSRASSTIPTAARGRITNDSREFDVAVNPYAAALREPGRSKRGWETDFLERQKNAKDGDSIQFAPSNPALLKL